MLAQKCQGQKGKNAISTLLQFFVKSNQEDNKTKDDKVQSVGAGEGMIP